MSDEIPTHIVVIGVYELGGGLLYSDENICRLFDQMHSLAQANKDLDSAELALAVLIERKKSAAYKLYAIHTEGRGGTVVSEECVVLKVEGIFHLGSN